MQPSSKCQPPVRYPARPVANQQSAQPQRQPLRQQLTLLPCKAPIQHRSLRITPAYKFLLALLISLWVIIPARPNPTSGGTDDLSERMKINIWEHLAKTANTSNFGVAKGLSAQEVLGTCFIPVCHHPSEISDQFSLLADKIRHNHLAWYKTYPTWGEATPTLPAGALKLVTPHVAAKHATCARFTNTREETYVPPGQAFDCAITQVLPSDMDYRTLPEGWFMSCNGMTFNYIPANLAQGTQCCVSRLTLVMPNQDMLLHGAGPTTAPRAELQRRPKRTLTIDTMDPSCDSHVVVFSNPEILSLAFSLVGVPGLAAANGRAIGRIACFAVKSINYTSTAISLLNKEQSQLREAILQNRQTSKI